MTVKPRLGNGDARKMVLWFREACNGCSFNFLASLIRNLLVKTYFTSYYLNLSLPVYSKTFFYILSNFSLVFLIDMFLLKKRVVFLRTY